jgi:hypothetical protein
VHPEFFQQKTVVDVHLQRTERFQILESAFSTP